MNDRVEKRRREYNEQFTVRVAPDHGHRIKRKCLRCDFQFKTDSPYQRLCYDCSHCEESKFWIESELKVR